MNINRLALLPIILIGVRLASAQSNPPIDTEVMVNLTGSGLQTNTYDDGSGRIDVVINQIAVNLQFHPYSPQPNGIFFTSSSADVNGTISLNITATETEYGLSDTDNLQNQLNYAETGFQVATGFFGPQFEGVNPGNVSSLFLDLPTTETQNPEPFALYYDGTNNTLNVGISLPDPFSGDSDICAIPCTATVTGNGSSFSGTVEDASSGEPISGAQVVIAGQTLTTGADGTFFVLYIAPGPLTIQISASGYISYQQTEPLPPFTVVAVPFKLNSATAQLAVYDANPMFLSSTTLPQAITAGLLQTLADASTTRNAAAADGLTKLLIEFTNNTPGKVVFTLIGEGALTVVDGTPLPDNGIDTVSVGGIQIAFALYTAPDQVLSSGESTEFSAALQPSDNSPPQETSVTIALVQTPVLLVHGLWADSSSWKEMQNMLTTWHIASLRVNYFDNTLFASGPFEAYGGIVNQNIQNMLTRLRESGVAVTTADVVAHSMGGILTRIDSNDNGSRRIDNYNHGYIRRVVTVDTPHWGSCAAPVLSLLASDVPWLGVALALNKHPVNKGGVEDLSPLNFAGNSGGTTSAAYENLSLPAFAIVGTVSRDIDFSSDLTELYFACYLASANLPVSSLTEENNLANLLCGQLFTTSDDMTMSGEIFLSQTDDGVVGAASQGGNCLLLDRFPDVEHTSAPTELAIQIEILNLLQGPVTAFANSGFPPVTQANLATQICPELLPNDRSAIWGGRKQPSPLPQGSPPLLSLIAPSNGLAVFSGSKISIVVQPLNNAALQFVGFLASGNNPNYSQLFAWDIVTNSPFTDQMAAPTNFFGPMTITALGVDNQGNYDVAQCTIQVLPGTNLTLESIAMNFNFAGTNLIFSELGVPQSLDVSGTYSDGGVRDITLGGAGTTYSTSAPSIVEVDTNGNVSAVSNGSAQITVMNGGLSVQVSIDVNLEPPEIMSIQPNSIQPGASNVVVSITGMNFGGASDVEFLINGQPDTNLTLGAFVMGVNAANIQVPLSVVSDTPVESLTVVVTTPVGNSGEGPTQGNQFSIGSSPPFIISEPTNSVAEPGSNATFAITSGGTIPLGYQWLFNGTALVAATNELLSLSDVQLTNAGSYEVVITNSYGSVTSSVVTLSISLPTMSATIAEGTNVQFQFAAAAGSNYVLQYVTNLSPPMTWLPVLTNAADSSGNWTFTDTNVSSFPARFFRIAAP